MERKDFGLPLLVCATLLLVLQPIIAKELDVFTGNMESMTSVLLLLLGAMPASPLVIVYSVRYGCDVDLASKLVVSTCVLSIFAARNNAKHVYAVENAGIAAIGEKTVAENGLSSKITVLKGLMEEV
jgi:predicted permease